ncbi:MULTISPECIES: hypothetical protein [unclassified Tatumella]|uniref:hypothetical protein n=1 Tax=unclassified Tatumella TaxID=2649542 RepID=UPI001BB041F8|nr:MULTISPECIES: hypothetical protein [unclassified Tatumella]MBS0878204.1 hypothetical protein [Tatumella sp. JGM82]MBS0891708.1 hypothetical protein [Tatumella sp. JGM94]MBS0902934.1 hypothetical protein [Tatumella sp. JGM100]
MARTLPQKRLKPNNACGDVLRKAGINPQPMSGTRYIRHCGDICYSQDTVSIGRALKSHK